MPCPLDKATLNSIRKGIATCQELERQIELANQAGVDVVEQQARCVHLQELMRKIVTTYDPELRAMGQQG